jgi:hypothetical protein
MMSGAEFSIIADIWQHGYQALGRSVTVRWEGAQGK